MRSSANVKAQGDGLTEVEKIARAAGIAGAEAVLAQYHANGFGVPQTWFTLQEAAAYLGIAETTLCTLVKKDVAPVSVKVGNGRRFHRDDLDTWIRNGGVHAFGGGAK